MRTCLLLLCFPFTLSVNGQRVTKVVTTKINFEVKGINDTLLEFYDDKDRVYKSEDSYGVSYKFYNDTMVCKQINVSKNIGKKNCRDTILFLYYYNKDQLSSSIIKSNKCPREPGGSDGFIRYEDTVQLSLETIDSIVYKYD